MKRCKWTGNDPLLIEYHDKEWGVPLFDDDRQFEFLSLEVMQCGLSWMTVLRKREVIRKAFDAFSPKLVSQYTDEDVFRIMNTEGMIRSERKIRAVISNARHFIEIQEEHGSFSNFIKFSFHPLVRVFHDPDFCVQCTTLPDNWEGRIFPLISASFLLTFYFRHV